MTKHDILITGGGLAGPALAIALAQSGLSVAIIDAAPERARDDRGFDGRAYALALASQRLLNALGMWDALAANAQPIREVKASQGIAGEGADPFFLHFNSAEIEEGAVGYMLEDRYLSRALHDAMEAAGITRLPNTRVTDQQVTDDQVILTLSDGKTLTGGLLIGADGRNSGTAKRAGIKRVGWDYGQIALVTAVEHQKPHEGIAQQFFMEGGPLAILPLRGNRSSIVWSENKAAATPIMAMDDEAFLDVLRPRFGDYLGDVSLAGERFSYPLSLSLAQSYVAPRVALIGDAAHGVHPIAGQGLNLGLRDVAALAEVLITAKRRGEDIAGKMVLDRYQQWRRFDATALALGMDQVNRLFGSSNPLVRAVRGFGMGAITAIPPLRKRFMQQAAGLTLDPMPRLLTGQQI